MSYSLKARLLAHSCVAAGLMALALPAWAHGITERLSLGPGGVEGNGYSGEPSTSAAGRFTAFDSFASNLVPSDTNGASDVFVRDRQTGTTERVSVGPNGVQGNGASGGEDSGPSISGGGRYVAFWSSASNLVRGDTNGFPDVFVRDRKAGKTCRVSLGPSGLQGNDESYDPSISAYGRFVAFVSSASNLVADDTNGVRDVFVHDRQTGTTKRVSVGQNGAQGNAFSSRPSISTDGRFVALESDASNLVADDTNGVRDMFVHDRQTGTTERVSVGPSGVQGNEYSYAPSISADGRFVAFTSEASNLVSDDTNGETDVFVRDRQMGTTELVSLGSGGVQGNNGSFVPSISANGRFVAFTSSASNLVPGDTNESDDVFVRNWLTGKTRRVSLGQGGVQGNSYSGEQSISPGGGFVAFDSAASNLVPDDTNDLPEVFGRSSAP